ncbi:glycosyltransferase family 4 protein [Candidatus Curtissbacteria bacterium]|nr:glycosyltransferase family 4 protein [Candidatus Curtissbacteria bacterium]
MTREENHFCIFLKEKPLPDLPKETENFKYKIFGPKKLWTQFALPVKLTFGEKLDVFFSPAHYGPRFSKVPYVVTVHDLSYLSFPQMFRRDDLLQLTAWSKYSIENSAHIIAPSQTTKDDIVKNYNVASSKITVTYEGYNKQLFKPQSKSKVESVKSKYKINGAYIIFVGTLQPRKNLERLIEAFYQLGRPLIGVEPLKLVICGKKGWLYDSIFEKVTQLKLESKVIFTDYVPDADLPALIGGASVDVLPSLWEGFGIPVIEAQACGVPVVVSETSSLPEIVGESGILVDPESVESIAKGIKKALDPKTRIILVKKGFENIKRFSWENCAKETLKVLGKATKDR